MASTLLTTVAVSVAWQYNSNPVSGTPATINNNQFSYQANTTNGTGAAGTCDLIYAVQGTLAGSGSDWG